MISVVPSCVRPGPQVTIATPTLPVVREYPSAIETAAASCRAEMIFACFFASEAHSHMLPSPMRPNRLSQPSASRASAIAS